MEGYIKIPQKKINLAYKNNPYGLKVKKKEFNLNDCKHPLTKVISGYVKDKFVVQTKCRVCGKVLDEKRI